MRTTTRTASDTAQGRAKALWLAACIVLPAATALCAPVAAPGPAAQAPSDRAAAKTATKEPPAPRARPAPDRGELKLKLPPFESIGTPPNLRKYKLRPPVKDRKILVPRGLDLKNVALGKPVTSSDEEPIIGELNLVTDGDKESHDGSYVEIGPGVQWVQVDLQKPHDLYAIVLWHYHADPRIYKDVVVQVSDDKDFIVNVRTLFNNDHDNSAGLGVGRDWQYIDGLMGEVVLPGKHTKGRYVANKPVRARYVRFYSNGNTSSDLNHYTEVEIYGTLKK